MEEGKRKVAWDPPVVVQQLLHKRMAGPMQVAQMQVAQVWHNGPGNDPLSCACSGLMGWRWAAGGTIDLRVWY